MKFNKKNILPIVLAGTLGCSVSCAFAHNTNGDPAKHKPCQPLKKQSYSAPKTGFFKQLNLSPEQRSNIQSIIDNAQHEAKPLRRDLQKSKFEFKQAITADIYEHKTINELAKSRCKTMKELLAYTKAMRKKRAHDHYEIAKLYGPCSGMGNRRYKVEGKKSYSKGKQYAYTHRWNHFYK